MDLFCLAGLIGYLAVGGMGQGQVGAAEAEDVFDGKTGTVTINYHDGEKGIGGASFCLYQTAIFSANDVEMTQTIEETPMPDTSNTLTDNTFADNMPSIVSLIDGLTFAGHDQADGYVLWGNGQAEPAAYASIVTSAYEKEEAGALYRIETDEKGEGIAEDVKAGLYLVEEIGSVEGYRSCQPFLLTVPLAEQTGWRWQIRAEPKPNPLGSLMVTKEVTGSDGEKDREFHFTITITAESEEESSQSYPYSKSDGTIGTVHNGNTITLSDGESITISAIPVSAAYEVEEIEADEEGYSTTSEGANGIIGKGDEAKAMFVNARDLADDQEEEITSGEDQKKGNGEQTGSEVKTDDDTPWETWLLIAGLSIALAGISVVVSAQNKVLLNRYQRGNERKRNEEKA